MNRIEVSTIALLFSMLVSSCGGSTTPAIEPTVSLVESLTPAAQTLEAQNVTQLPVGTATAIPSPMPMPTNTATSVAMLVPTATKYPTQVVQFICDGASFIADVSIPDYTELEPGETFTKTWSMQNTGSCTWDEGYAINFTGGDSMSGASSPLDQTVAPGEVAGVSVALAAPLTAGEYTGYWQLANEGGVLFGDQVFVLIVVLGDAAATPTTMPETPTPTNTTVASPIPTEIPAQSPTAQSTETAVQTSIPSETPSPTSDV